MYRLYLLLKDRAEPPTDEEKDIAGGRKSLDAAKAAEYVKHLEKSSTNIVNLFNQQHQQAAVRPLPIFDRNLIEIHCFVQEQSWDQDTFERLLSEWIVACDQPFDEVEKPEFRQLLEYTHLRPSLHIPHRGAVKKRIMKMGEDTIEDVKKMIEVFH